MASNGYLSSVSFRSDEELGKTWMIHPTHTHKFKVTEAIISINVEKLGFIIIKISGLKVDNVNA